MKKLKKWWNRFLDVTGLDWLPVIVSDRWYKPQPRTNPEAMDSFEAHHQKLNLEQTKDLIQELTKMAADEDKRQDKIEAKAFSLISFTGLSSAFVAGLVTVMSSAQFSENLRHRVVIVYSFVLLSLFITVVLGIKAIRVGKFSFMFPHVTNLWEREGMNEVAYRRDQARILLRSYFHNHGIINDKASFVAGAQDWFRNTIVLLMVMTAFIVFTPNQTSPTSTLPPTATQTAISTIAPTAAPSETATPMITPSETPTQMPSETPSPTP